MKVEDQETSRELFEEWATEKGFCLDSIWSQEGMPYEDQDTALAFEIWQAALATRG